MQRSVRSRGGPGFINGRSFISENRCPVSGKETPVRREGKLSPVCIGSKCIYEYLFTRDERMEEKNLIY